MGALNGSKPKHVLIVDDDLELAFVHQALLQFNGYHVTTAGNGALALKLVADTDVDAVLCDLDMPELSGDLFYREAGITRPELLKRFVFLTGQADNPLYEDFLRSVQAPVLRKPAPLNLLLGVLQKILHLDTAPRRSHSQIVLND